MDVTKTYECIGFGAMDVTKTYRKCVENLPGRADSRSRPKLVYCVVSLRTTAISCTGDTSDGHLTGEVSSVRLLMFFELAKERLATPTSYQINGSND